VTQPSPLHVLYLSRVRLNPYVRLLAAGVERADPAIRTEIVAVLPWSRVALAPAPPVLHLHWVELQFAYGHPGLQRARLSWQALRLALSALRHRGTRLVYTVHNLHPHDEPFAALHEAAHGWLFAHADAIHVHDAGTAATIAARWGRRKRVFVIPHGHYREVYPADVSRAEARRRLQLPAEAFIYLCLGQIRPYKGIDRLIHAFRHLNDPATMLVIAGHLTSPAYGRHLHRLIADHPNIRLHTAYIPDDELQVFFNAADACVLPYRRATTSGAALLALSFGKPIVAPNLGPFPELITDGSGVLFEAGEDGLVKALQAVRALDPEQARAAALGVAATRDWTRLGAQHAAVYRQLVAL
jgi:glycosyltransferase involved in cell wall biosynthesis